jgi:hypothetical protein
MPPPTVIECPRCLRWFERDRRRKEVKQKMAVDRLFVACRCGMRIEVKRGK